MSKIHADHIFTSESVSEGHPDKVCDQISDAILDACLAQDPNSRVACETLATTDLIVISGEITTKAEVNWEKIARDVVADIGYTSNDIGFSAKDCKVFVSIHAQSPDISQGVTVGQGLHKEQGAGDQGMMFGYASNETKELMPAPILYAHKIVAELARLRKTQPKKYAFLRPDAKSQVSIHYKDGVPVAVDTIVVSHQHTPEMKKEQLEKLVKDVVKKVIPAGLLKGNTKCDDTKCAAKLYSPITGIYVEVYTNEPGIQFYSGNFLDGSGIDKQGNTMEQRTGCCLETQKFPDSPNKADLPGWYSAVLEPGQEYYSHCIYQFGVE